MCIVKAVSSLFHVKSRTVPPQCLLDPKLGEHKYVTVNNGQKIHYVESGDPSKPLLVFQHGFPEFWWTWRAQIKHFQQDYHVVALDMRGYNESGKPAGIESYYLMNMVDDLKGLVESQGVSKFTLVAHDWGAVIAWVFAVSYPDMLNSLVILNGPHLPAIQDLRASSWGQALKSWYIIFFQCPILPELMCMAQDMESFKIFFKDSGCETDEEMMEAFKYAFRDYSTWNRTINYYRNRMSKSFIKEIRSKGKIKVPTLVIHGTADKALSVGVAKESYKYVEKGSLELVEGISHWIQNEAPDRVNQLIDEFFRKNHL